jgi:hypothetical protein
VTVAPLPSAAELMVPEMLWGADGVSPEPDEVEVPMQPSMSRQHNQQGIDANVSERARRSFMGRWLPMSVVTSRADIGSKKDNREVE